MNSYGKRAAHGLVRNIGCGSRLLREAAMGTRNSLAMFALASAFLVVSAAMAGRKPIACCTASVVARTAEPPGR